MDKITNVIIKPLEESQYVTPITVHYKQNGQDKKWDLIKVHNSVSIIIYNTSRNVLVLVKQFRPAAYYAGIPACDKKGSIDTDKYPADRGMMLELCAGIVDKNKPLEEIAREEVLEECGYDIPLSCMSRVISYRSAVGVCGDEQTLFFAEVTDDMRVNQGNQTEFINGGSFCNFVSTELDRARRLDVLYCIRCSDFAIENKDKME